jgi:hypothetical protein
MGRNKKREDRKRKKISTTIDPELWESLTEYCDDNDLKRSRLIEKWIKDGLKDPEVLKKLNDEGIIFPDSDLLE